MKYKKNTFSIIIVLILALVSVPHHTYALKQALFPNAQSLQPLPPDVHANISGNTNSTTVSPSSINMLDTTDTSSDELTQVDESVPAAQESGLLVWISILGLCIIGFFVYRKLKRDGTIS